MSNEWEVIEDKELMGKRFIKICDTVNKLFYSSIFKIDDTDVQIKIRFKAQVKEHRQEIEDRKNKINFKNFEQELGV